MKKLFSVTLLLASFSACAGNNDIYLTQTGDGLTLTIDQVGESNTVGESDARVTLSGSNMTVDIDQLGDSNSVAASILQANSTSYTYTVTGDSNEATFTVGGTGDTQNSDFDFAAIGDSNALTFTQGDSATATGGNQDFDVTGTSNDLNVKCNVVGCINDWTVDGNSNNIDTTQSGQSDHQVTFRSYGRQ